MVVALQLCSEVVRLMEVITVTDRTKDFFCLFPGIYTLHHFQLTVFGDFFSAFSPGNVPLLLVSSC